MSGRIKAGQRVIVLGEGYSVYNEEDMLVQDVTDIWVSEARCVCVCVCVQVSPALWQCAKARY
jgi:hypothetical protein